MPHVTCGFSWVELDGDDAVVRRVVVGAKRAPPLESVLPGGTARCGRPALEIGERHVVGRDHPRARAGLDRHVAHRHAAVHRERLDRRPGVLEHVTLAARDAQLPDRGQHEVLRRQPERQVALEAHLHRLRQHLLQGLRREHMLDLGGADPERERTECAVGRRMAVTADDRHPGLRDTDLGTDHVDDSLAPAAGREERHAERLAVRAKRVELRARERVGDRAVERGDVVIHRRERQVGTAHWTPGQPQRLEGLRARHLVHEMQVDVEQRRRVGRRLDDVRVPDLAKQRRAGHRVTSAA